jgi:microcystin-dependent protein
MSDPFLGEIQAFAFGFVPKGWALCNGAVLPLRSYTALYSLLGTQYGGNGTTTLALPNLTGRVAISQGQGPGLPGYVVGEDVGGPAVTLGIAEMPTHTHGLQLGAATAPEATPGPSAASNVAIDPTINGFVAPPTTTAFSANAIVPIGGSQSHDNRQPTLALVYCIAVDGIFPQFN